MALEVTETPRSGATMIVATGTFAVPAEKMLKLESTPNGEEHFVRAVPSGKAWQQVHVTIEITESDA